MNSKEKCIAEAYGELLGKEKYNLIKNQINENGVCRLMDDRHMFITENTTLLDLGFKRNDERIRNWLDSDGGYFMPKSLDGLENNRGWIKIESEADLPKETTRCWVYNINNKFNFQQDETFNYMNVDNFKRQVNKWLKKYTHWKPMHFEKPPIH